MTDPLCVLLMYLRPAPSLSDHRSVQLLKDFKSAVREATTGRPEWTRQLDDVRNIQKTKSAWNWTGCCLDCPWLCFVQIAKPVSSAYGLNVAELTFIYVCVHLRVYHWWPWWWLLVCFGHGCLFHRCLIIRSFLRAFLKHAQEVVWLIDDVIDQAQQNGQQQRRQFALARHVLDVLKRGLDPSRRWRSKAVEIRG